MRIKVVSTRTLEFDVDLSAYMKEDRYIDRIIAIEKENAEEFVEYFEHPDTQEYITVEGIDNGKFK